MAALSLSQDTTVAESVNHPESKSVQVKIIDRCHTEHKLLSETWNKISLLYAGGWAIKSSAEQFLVRRPKELSDVYQARLNRFTYTNHLGTALDWYASELFEEDPFIEACTKDGNPVASKKKVFYDEFLLDCDKGGSPFVDFQREVFQNILLYQTAYVLVDLPEKTEDYLTLLDQKQAGALNPYLTVFTPMETINWELDRYGNLNWVIFKSSSVKSDGPMDKPVAVDRWYVYDRKQFQVWERLHSPDEKTVAPDAVATLVNEGPHSMSGLNRVPVRRLTVPDGLWLANRAYLAAVSHLNTDNVLDWALFMSALAMPVIFTDSEVQITLAEAGFLKFPADAKYEWSEPQGQSFKHLEDRILSLTENIFRSFYLIHQGRSGRATPTAQSGISKQMDMLPSRDILKMFGDLLRRFMQLTLKDVSMVYGDKDLEWDVRGFEFKEDISLETVQSITETIALGIPSEKFERELLKRIAKMQLPDLNPSAMRKIFEQIDAAPLKAVRDLQALVDKAQLLAQFAPQPTAPGTSGKPGQPGKPGEKDPTAIAPKMAKSSGGPPSGMETEGGN